MRSVYFSDVTAWAPSLGSDAELWQEWASNVIPIAQTKESPKLEYTDPLFRRRLSQITKMTVHVIHTLLESTHINPQTKIVFISLRGEIEREFTVNKNLIEDGMILPAAFSLSVFNTPVSQATLAFALKGGYSVVYPSRGDFCSAFKIACAPLLAGTESQIILVYADELVPGVYGQKIPQENEPLAFAGILSAEKKPRSVCFDDFSNVPDSPHEFLKLILQ